MLSKNVILLTIQTAGGKRMEHWKVRKLIKNKTKMITMRINPELLERLYEAIEKDKSIPNWNDFIEDCIPRHLESKRQDLNLLPIHYLFFACYFSLNPLI